MIVRSANTTNPRLATLTALALAAGILAALVPGMARVPAVLEAPAGPLAAPPPAILTSAEFPEQASPARGCTAVLERSSAVDNRRAAVATRITNALLVDACLGG